MKSARSRPTWKMFLTSSLTNIKPKERRPMDSPFRGFRAIFYKESLHLRRDSMAIMFALLIPLVEMVILGAAIDTNVRQVKTVVFDQSGIMEQSGESHGSQQS